VEAVTADANPPELAVREEELLQVLAPFRSVLLRLPGCTGVGIGLTAAAFDRLRSTDGGPESLRAEDIVIIVGFETDTGLAGSARRVDQLLGDAPHECHVKGRAILL
jgi:hypothetical protein